MWLRLFPWIRKQPRYPYNCLCQNCESWSHLGAKRWPLWWWCSDIWRGKACWVDLVLYHGSILKFCSGTPWSHPWCRKGLGEVLKFGILRLHQPPTMPQEKGGRKSTTDEAYHGLYKGWPFFNKPWQGSFNWWRQSKQFCWWTWGWIECFKISVSIFRFQSC